MQKIKKSVIRNCKFLIILVSFLVPTFSFAADTPLVTCYVNCGFNDLMNLINNIIHFLLFDMAVPIAAIMFFYAGFELVTSGGSTEKRGIAHKVFFNAVIGLVLAVAAWLIVRTLLSILGYNGTWIGFTS